MPGQLEVVDRPGFTTLSRTPPGPAPETRSMTARWETIRYALDSTPRTVRLCTILLAPSLPSTATVLLLFLLHR